MIRLDIEQGSQEWRDIRLGIPTASNFGRIISPKSLKYSSSADKYMLQLLAEWALGEPGEDLYTPFVDRGSLQEREAVAYYELRENIKTEKVGFCLRDDGLVGCSPDRLIGDNGGLEIKCPSAETHLSYLLESIAEIYKPQLQGCLYICERDWWDILSYNPYLPKAVLRVYRDSEFIGYLDKYLERFLDELEVKKEKLRSIGVEEFKEELPEGWPFD